MGVLESLNRELGGGKVSQALQNELKTSQGETKNYVVSGNKETAPKTYAEVLENQQRGYQAGQTYAQAAENLLTGGKAKQDIQKTVLQSTDRIENAAERIDAQIAAKQGEYDRIITQGTTASGSDLERLEREVSQLQADKTVLTENYYQVKSKEDAETMPAEVRNTWDNLQLVKRVMSDRFTASDAEAVQKLAQEKLGDRQTSARVAAEQLYSLLSSEIKPYEDTYKLAFDYLQKQQSAAEAEALQKSREKQIEESGFLGKAAASALSVAAAPLQGLEYLRIPFSAARDKGDIKNYTPYDPNGMKAVNLVQGLRGAVTESIESPVGQFLYQTGMSIADSAAQVALFGPAATYVLGTSAAANQAQDILNRGGTNRQAIWGGAAAGAAEMIFEKFSIDNLLKAKNITGMKRLLTETLKQMGTEASEEMATEIANILSDAVIMGELSTNRQKVQAYIEQGMSEADAKQKVLLESIGDVVLAGLGGAISGGVMGIVTNAGRMSGQKSAAKATAQQERQQTEGEGQDIAEAQDAAEREKTASTGEAESTAVNTDPAQHTPAEQEVIDSYQGAVDENLVNFVETSIANKGANKGRYILKPVSERAAEDIRALTGVDTTGFKTVMEQRMAEHIYDEHGPNGTTDHSMADLNDIGRIQYVLDNYDAAKEGGTVGSYTTIKPNGKPGLAKAVVFEKAINGTYYVVEAVPDTKAKTTYVVSAYLSKNGGGRKVEARYPASAQSALTRTSKNADIVTSTDPTITQTESGVNREYARDGEEKTTAEAELTREQKGTEEAVPKALAMIEAGEPVYRIVEETGLYRAEDGTLRNQFGMTVYTPGETANETNETVTQNEKTASTGETESVTVYSSGKSALEGKDSLAKTLAQNIGTISDMQPVSMLSGTEMNETGKKPSEQIRDFFSKIGSVFRKGFGQVRFGEYGVGGILNHRPLNRAKMVSLTAVPDVIKNGRIISDVDNWKGRGYRSVVFAAPATINGTPVYIAAVVNQNPDGKFYLNECVDSEGNYIRIENTPTDNAKSGVTVQDGVTATPAEVFSDTTIPQSESGVNREYARDGAGDTSTRDSMPKKAQKALEKTERRLENRVAEIMSVPRWAKREFLKPIVREISNEYLESGAVSDAALERLFNKAYDEGIKVDEEFYQNYRDLKELLREYPISISEQDAADIQGYEGLEQFRKQNLGTLNIKKDGNPVDTVYAELMHTWPELFPEDITHPGEQLLQISEVAKSIRKVARRLDEIYYEGAQDDFRRWARNEFNAAVNDAVATMNLAKRYAEDRSKAKKPAGSLTSRDVKELYSAVKDARRAYEKESAKALLTKEDKRTIDRMIRGEIDPEKYRGVNAAAIKRVYQAKAGYEAINRTIRDYNTQRRQELRDRADELLKTANTWKDKAAGILYSRETMKRNIRDIAPDKEAKAIIAEYFEPVQEHEAEATQFKDHMRDQVRALKISRKVDEGNQVSEAYAVQLIGEARSAIDYLLAHPETDMREGKKLEDWKGVLDDVAANNPNLDMEKIDRAIETFRNLYDIMFQQMNEIRIRNGYEPVDYRQGYFPHFRKDTPDGLLGMFGKALGIQTDVTELPTSINGITHTFKPGIQWFGHGKKRTGFDTEYDAVEGFDKYIEGVANVIYHTDDIQKLRALATQMRYRTTDEGMQEQINAIETDSRLTPEEKETALEKLAENGRYTLSNFVVELDEYTNILAGKKSRHDRSVETEVGRRMYNVVKAMESRVAANMVAVNPGSWLTNFIPITQAWASVDTRNMMKGMWGTLRAYKEDDGFVGRSIFLTNRRGSDPLVRTWSQKAGDVMSKPMEYIDQFTADTIVRARYAQNKARGMSEREAMREADSFAADVMADRSKGSMPTLFERKNPGTKLLTQFQLEVNNQLSYLFKDIPREKRDKGMKALAAALLKFAIGEFLFNEIYEFIVGRRPALDPIGILNDTVGDLTGYELPNLVEAAGSLMRGEGIDFTTEKLGAYGAAEGLGENLAENMPFVGGLLGGGRIPISSALPNIENLGKAALNTEWSAEKRWATAGKEMAAPLTYMILPFGGGQLKKAYQTIDTLIKGGKYTVNAQGEEQLQYPVYRDSAGDIARSALFGPTSTRTGREWIEGGFKSLGAKETAVYQALTQELGVDQRDAYELIQDIRAAEKTEDVSEAEQERRVLAASDMSGEGKAAVYYGMMANDREKKAMDDQAQLGADAGKTYDLLMELKDMTKTADKIDAVFSSGLDDQQKLTMYYDIVASDTRKEAVDELLGAGTDPKDMVDMIREYQRISEQDEKPVDQATEFAHWMDGREFTKEQADIINERFGFSSGYRVSADKYNEMKESGMNPDSALAVYETMQSLKPENGTESVTSQQKYTAIAGMDISDAEKLAAILAYDPSEDASTYRKYADAYEEGMSVSEFNEYRVTVSGITSDKDEKGNAIPGSKKEKVIAVIHSMQISDAEKDYLYLMDYAESGLDQTPWHNYAGDLPTAANGFRGMYRNSGIQTGTLRGQNSLRGASSLRGKNNLR